MSAVFANLFGWWLICTTDLIETHNHNPALMDKVSGTHLCIYLETSEETTQLGPTYLKIEDYKDLASQ